MSNNGDNKEAENELKQDIDHEIREKGNKINVLSKSGGTMINDKCPLCGSKDRVFETFYEYLAKQKKVQGGQSAFSSIDNQIFPNPAASLIGGTAPGLTVLRDICMECFTEYPIRIVRSDVVIQIPT